MTDNDIKKALECCRTNIITDCKRCNLRLEDGRTQPFCTTILIGNALYLINRLQEENKKNENIIRLADKTIETANAEIERLRNHIQEGIDLAKQIPETIAIIKDKAYKEFAERLKQVLYNDEYILIRSIIDNLLKEMVGEENA